MKKQLVTGNIKIPSKKLEILKNNFSNCFSKKGNFDFEKFKQELSKNEDIDFSDESYGMDWLGKSYARLLASDEATTLLKENEEWDRKKENKDSENLLIKGDNLEVLKHLSNAYYEKIKMIYIDPPYNTGGDGFVYQDDRKFSVEELSKLAGVDEEKAKRILDFTQSKSNSHSAWLTFMYPRLYIAKQLLKEDGVIFVSIDDNEVAQLRILMDEIFGEENFVNLLVWEKKVRPSNKNKNGFSKVSENILFYKRQFEDYVIDKNNLDPAYIKKVYKNPDNDPRGSWRTKPLWSDSNTNKEKALILKDGTELSKKWFISQETLNELFEKDKIYISSTGSLNEKLFLEENTGQNPLEILFAEEYYTTEHGTKELKELFNQEAVFQNPKPVLLLKNIIRKSNISKNDLILDFFAGSGTTGDAVMQLNVEDGGNRKYILVQLPEEIDKKKNKTAYDFVKNELKVESPTIFDITKERLIRAGKKIQEDLIDNKIVEKEKEVKDIKNKLDLGDKKEKIKQLNAEIKRLEKNDLGFKLFETIPIWEDYDFEAEKFYKQHKLFDESKLSKEDLRILLTTWKTYDGIPLTQNLKEIDLDGYKGCYFDNKLYLLDKGFKTKHLKKLLEEIDSNKDFNPAIVIVFGYNFQSKILREIADNIKNYVNKKQIDIDFTTRY